ncbi:S8 family serine peptidase [Priestia megaterium]|uniref:S8 family serine peptidase n=1 Tax=Priestia megaterium TaxID=1404 RepID=UPI002877BA03|nr:hypothetical protein [Priestia megaterium]MBX4164574.1 hypothetical protein [Priestia megaterium]
MCKFRLIPFTVEKIVEDIKEIPEGVKIIKAPEFWNDSDKGAGIVIAVIDSGCQTNHPDLKRRIFGL